MRRFCRARPLQYEGEGVSPELEVAIEKMEGWRAKFRRPGSMIYALSGLTAGDVDIILEAVRKKR